MDKLKNAWRWVRDHAVAILGAIAALLAIAWGIDYARRRIGGLKDRVEVERARRDIAGLQARRDRLVEEVAEDDDRVAEIDKELVAKKREVVAAHEAIDGMSEEEVVDAFARLGY